MKICLILEGSYPYVHGGVSTWMHSYITQMPQNTFVLWVIGAREEDKGKFVYELPENVIEVHEVFLDTPLLRDSSIGKKQFSEEEKNALRELIRLKKPDWNVLAHMMQKGDCSQTDVLQSDTFLEILTELCRTEYPNIPFAYAFHTCRSMLLPVLFLLRQAVPDADLYHTICTGYGGLLGVLAHFMTGKPLELTEHGIYSREREEELIQATWVLPEFKQQWIRFYYMLSDICYEQAKIVTCLFERARDTQISLGVDPKKDYVVPNGIRYDRFSPIPLKKEDGYVDIGAVIRLAPIKDVKTLIHAFYELSSRMSRVRLHILGSTDDEEYGQECHELAEYLHLDNLRFVGRQDVVKYMEKLDFTILTSISEGQPLSVLESFAARRPAVTTDVGCCRELIYGQTGDHFGPAGIVTSPMNRKGLADAMEKLCRSRQLRLEYGRAGQARVEKYYQQSQMMDKYQELYTKIMEEEAHGGDRI